MIGVLALLVVRAVLAPINLGITNSVIVAGAVIIIELLYAVVSVPEFASSTYVPAAEN